MKHVISDCLFTNLSEVEREQALNRFHVIRPFLNGDVPLAEIARQECIALRTAWLWVDRYRRDGLGGLGRRPRVDRNTRRISSKLQKAIEGMALRKPRVSIATIHRKAVTLAEELQERPPSYSSVYAVIRELEPALVTMAHEGTKAYSETFDLIHRAEAEGPNAIWQADHTLLDIWIVDEEGKSKKPWLTIILDDYSRAVAGYFLSFSAPSAIQTSLALRQAIWRKAQTGWHVCGIPQILYTDHGSDFTSQHMEQVVADLKIRLIFSAVGRPRGRGKIERFFGSINQVFLSHLPGYSPSGTTTRAALTLPALAKELDAYIVHEYNVTPHSTTGKPPQARWEAGGFLPQMPTSLEQLDLLLLTVAKTRRVQQDGIQFMGMRYIDPTLAAYVGETVLLRYDPRDVAEIRVFHHDHFLCRAICQELAGETVALREIVNARDRRRRELRQTLDDRRHAVDSLLEIKQWNIPKDDLPQPPLVPVKSAIRLKRYVNE